MKPIRKRIILCSLILLILFITAAAFCLFPALRTKARTDSSYTVAELTALEEIFGVSLSNGQTVQECRLVYGLTPQAFLWVDLKEGNLSFVGEGSFVWRFQRETAYTPQGEAIYGGDCYERSDSKNAGEKVIIYSDSKGNQYLYCIVPKLTKEQMALLRNILK